MTPRDQTEEHAVLLHIPLAGRTPVEAELERYQEIQDELEAAIERAGVGEFDGDEWGEGMCTLYMYGPNADQLWAAIAPVLAKNAFPQGSAAVKRWGGPGSKEVRVSVAQAGKQARQ